MTPEASLLREIRAALGLPDVTAELEQIERLQEEAMRTMSNDPYRYFDGAKFKEDDHCQRCGSLLNGEAALVNDEVWCHPCADAVTAAD